MSGLSFPQLLAEPWTRRLWGQCMTAAGRNVGALQTPHPASHQVLPVGTRGTTQASVSLSVKWAQRRPF